MLSFSSNAASSYNFQNQRCKKSWEERGPSSSRLARGHGGDDVCNFLPFPIQTSPNLPPPTKSSLVTIRQGCINWSLQSCAVWKMGGGASPPLLILCIFSACCLRLSESSCAFKTYLYNSQEETDKNHAEYQLAGIRKTDVLLKSFCY